MLLFLLVILYAVEMQISVLFADNTESISASVILKKKKNYFGSSEIISLPRDRQSDTWASAIHGQMITVRFCSSDNCLSDFTLFREIHHK